MSFRADVFAGGGGVWVRFEAVQRADLLSSTIHRSATTSRSQATISGLGPWVLTFNVGAFTYFALDRCMADPFCRSVLRPDRLGQSESLLRLQYHPAEHQVLQHWDFYNPAAQLIRFEPVS